ncbi:MAG: Ig-like domain-containing protein [Acidobacteria bacterium]|nr:Ig-like domain-containing protein [Acidobacteriota bacterium]
MKRYVVAVLCLLALAAQGQNNNKLSIVSAGPVGEVAKLAEANEVRVVFSEPMVVVGKIPATFTPPWFKIEPAAEGAFRWSGTTTLIFTPKSLPFATKYTVSIAPSATSIAGNKLDQAYQFSFVTPTIRLKNVDWYRKGGYDSPIVIGLRFNQPVESAVVVPHLQLRTVAHEYKQPEIPDAGQERLQKLDPQALEAFKAKAAKAAAAAASNGQPVLSFIATDWNKERLKPGKDLVVVETKPGVQPDTNLQVYLDSQLAKGTSIASGQEQQFTIELGPMLFIDSPDCLTECDPEGGNYFNFRTRIGADFAKMLKAVSVTDITDPAKEVVLKPTPVANREVNTAWGFSLDDLGYSVVPAHKYAVRVDPTLEMADGQKLGYTYMAVLDYWHRSAFISFGDGHGVWESTGGPQLPFHARNYKSVKQWLAPLKIEDLMPTAIAFEENGANQPPPNAKPTDRTLKPATDKIQSYGFNLKPALGEDNMGLAWAAVQEGTPIAKSRPYGGEEGQIKATVVQATNLGISVKDSPQNTLVMVTRLDNAQPVAGASVSIRNRDNKVIWSGTTDARGIAMAPDTDIRREKPDEAEYDESWKWLSAVRFLVTAEKDGDVAYVVSNWNEGIQPWDFGSNFSLREAEPLLRGTVFPDRGVYKLGEEAHVKAIIRSDTPGGMKLLPAGTNLDVELHDSRDRVIDTRKVALNEWSSAEWTVRIPEDAPLGGYYFKATLAGHREEITRQMLVAAYRRPEFRVDLTMTSANPIAGAKIDGKISGRYLFGGAMNGQTVRWTYSKEPVNDVPPKIRNKFQEEQWVFLGWDQEIMDQGSTQLEQKEDLKLNAQGDLKLSLATDKAAGWPYDYKLEAEVTDVSRQAIGNRTAIRVHPAPWYIGLSNPPYFADTQKGLDTQVVAVTPEGVATAGVDVKLELFQLQWVSARKSEGGDFYEWDGEIKKVPAGSWNVTTGVDPVAQHIAIKNGGEYELLATATDKSGRSTHTRVGFYAVGDGYTSWQRYDHNRIDLVPEKKQYKPGDTARILIKSPWEKATGLITMEREGVRSSTPFQLTSTQQTISVPITENDVPNVYVSVLLVKGRSKDGSADAADPGKPAFRLGYVELKVEDAAKRLKVDVKADRDEFRPAAKAKIDVTVKDAATKPVRSEVTLWAVDYGVLSLTAYQTPDVVPSVWIEKALQVATEDSREKIVSRRVLTPKGADEGGGGGRDAGPGVMRKDFRVLAFWLGSIATDKNGKAHTEVTLPESLTTYRIMAVAADKTSRFGFAQNEIKVNKPVLLTPTWPRFLAVGDTAYFGGVVHSQLKQKGTATVTIKSLDPSLLELTGETTSKADVASGGATEVRFNAKAKAVGNARLQMTVTMSGESDAFEDVIPIRVFVTPETYAAYGDTQTTAKETVEIPNGTVPNFGGIHIETASTAMVGLSEGAQYLVDYPYGCAEQRSSGALALMLTADLGDAFQLQGIDAKNGRKTAQATLDQLPKFQCGSGGFTYWAGECSMDSPYLTAWVLHVMHRGQKLGYNVDKTMLDNAYKYLETELGKPRPTNEGWYPAYTAWQAFAVRTLVEGGRNEDSHLTRLAGYADRMPLFGIAWLTDAMLMKGEKSDRLTDLQRRLTNAILPEGGTAHVEELKDPYLLYFWSSNVRTTAIALGTLVRGGQDEQLVKRMVRWLMQVRKGGRWGNTQENAWAMESLIDYYRKYENEVPDFTAVVNLGTDNVGRDVFKGRSTQSEAHDLKLPAPGTLPVTFARDGKAGTLFYLMRLRFATTEPIKTPLDQGISVQRSYDGKTSFKAGDLIKVTITVKNTKERRFVVVDDPIPAGTEPVEAWFATTASDLKEQIDYQNSDHESWAWWMRTGFDHIERHDDRVDIFATRLGEGDHDYKYLLRATTAGTFVTAPMHAEEMYEPEVFGRTATDVVEVKP